MASITTESNGRRVIQFVGSDGKRRSVRLGKVSKRDAESVCCRIDGLLAASITGQAVSRDLAAWLASIADVLHAKLVRVGLVEARVSAERFTLKAFTDEYIASRTDAKPLTIVHLRRAQRGLVEFFGPGRPLASLTRGDADRYRLHLLGRGLAENTVRRMCGRARQFFHVAMRSDVMAKNPFEGIRCNVGANPSRLHFVTREVALKVLDACPDGEWRLIFALSRFGGMRCPSEHLALRWEDVNWEHNRMTVRSPKTEHHEGKASRMVPIFPELRPYLLAMFEQAEPGSVHVITRHRTANTNLRTQMHRIIRQAGLEPWPKTFHNLRASRETELAESFPLHVVCAWIGNSQPIAAKHYLQVTDEHFSRATSEPSKTVQIPVQQASASERRQTHREYSSSHQVQHLHGDALSCASMHAQRMPPSGLEPETR